MGNKLRNAESEDKLSDTKDYSKENYAGIYLHHVSLVEQEGKIFRFPTQTPQDIETIAVAGA